MGRKRGRPSEFKPEYIHQAFALALLGITDKEMAGVFQVSEVTLNAWKKAHPEFLKSLKDGRAGADAKVTHSLFHRALGYTHPAVKIFNDDGEPLEVPYEEHYPPDPVACIFWLKNRRPDLWRDRPDTVINVQQNQVTTTITIPPEVYKLARQIAETEARAKARAIDSGSSGQALELRPA